MIRLAVPEDLAGIKDLWQEAFGDSPEYIDLFLTNRMQYENTLIYQDKDQVVGQLFILPCQLSFDAKRYSGGYIYCVATGKKYRGRGISTLLLEEAHRLLALRGYQVALLVPGEKSLFQFYEKRGYSVQGALNIDIVQSNTLHGNSDIEFHPIALPDILRLRETYFGQGYLMWDEKAMEYVLLENSFLGGQFLGFSWQGKEGFVSCLPYEDSLMIKELACPAPAVDSVLNKLHTLYGKERYLLRLSSNIPRGNAASAAMCHWLTSSRESEPFYLSHFLD